MSQMPAPMTAFDDDSAANPPRSEGVSVDAIRASLDREVAGAVAPLGEALRLSRDAAGAMRAELERLEGRFREIKAEAADLGPAAAGELAGGRIACSEDVARRLESLCGKADGAQQRLLEAVEAAGEVVGVMGGAPERVEDLEARGGRLMRACEEVESRQRDLAAEADRRRAEIERIAEMPLARIEAAADAAAARLEALIDRASEAAARAQAVSMEQEALESSLQEATERLAPWAPVVAGEAPGPVADLLGLVRSELHQEVASLGDGLTKLAEAIVELAQARPARRVRPARSASPKRAPAQQIEGKPRRASATARAATSMKAVARGGGAGTKSSRRTTSRGKAAARGAKAKAKAGAGAKRGGSRGKGARKTAAGRRR